MKYYAIKNGDKFLKHTINVTSGTTKVITLFDSPVDALSYATYGSSIVEYELNEVGRYSDGQLPEKETIDV